MLLLLDNLLNDVIDLDFIIFSKQCLHLDTYLLNTVKELTDKILFHLNIYVT